eukprot:NODE_4192_length_488_cov_296.968109_g3590_i0.p2 GENE.NODE_4192_length_488_cov_296.968109_g3590_i0~~NODE_4192_length_488_cov_296.968109_g3590_i0.p2  ORF type:complete len:131 (-),score=53.90 NODE_4192_length_488_cov_296.968109_g3590_i0:96-437(-)
MSDLKKAPAMAKAAKVTVNPACYKDKNLRINSQVAEKDVIVEWTGWAPKKCATTAKGLSSKRLGIFSGDKNKQALEGCPTRCTAAGNQGWTGSWSETKSGGKGFCNCFNLQLV